MAEFQPEIKKLQKKYANDKQKLAAEMQKLQSEHGVNPLAGCLPILLQAPVFIGLNHVLRSFNRTGLSYEQNIKIPNYWLPTEDVQSRLAQEHARARDHLHHPAVDQALVAVTDAEEPDPTRRAGLRRGPQRGVHPGAVPTRGQERDGLHPVAPFCSVPTRARSNTAASPDTQGSSPPSCSLLSAT